MRILALTIGGFQNSTLPFFQEALADHDVIFFTSNYQCYKCSEFKSEFTPEAIDIPPYPQFYYDYNTGLQTILKDLPEGWEPDLVIIFYIESNIIPLDIESSPYPVIGLLFDWYTCASSLKDTFKRFDYIFLGDRKGLDIFRKSGFTRIINIPHHGFSPTFHKKLPHAEKIYDITFIGSLNHDIHQQRAQWLYRLAKLSDRYKIQILTNVYAEEYVKILNQSKITFNYTITGAMNMRAYEAAACGSLLFTEKSNTEITDYLTDREDCILYDEHNFEELLEYYLKNDNERNRIIDNAYKKIQNYSYKKLMERILNKCSEINFHENKREISDPQKHLTVIANQIYKGEFPFSHYVIQKLKESEETLENLNTLTVFYLVLAEISDDTDLKIQIYNKVLQYALKAIEKKPDHPILNYHLGSIYYNLNDVPKAIEYWEKCVEILESDKNHDLSELIYPYRYNSFSSVWEKNEYANINNPDLLIDKRKKILLSKCLEYLGFIYINTNDFTKAEEKLKKALPLSAEPHITAAGIGELCYYKGNLDAATDMFRLSLKNMPFQVSAWNFLLTALKEKGLHKKCMEFCLELYRVLKAVPYYNKSKPTIDHIANEIIEYQIINNLQEAEYTINTALSIDKQNPYFLFYKNVIDFKLKKSDFSLEKFHLEDDLDNKIKLLNKLLPSIQTSYTVFVETSNPIARNILISPYFIESDMLPDLHVQIVENETKTLTGRLNAGYILNKDIDYNELTQFDMLLVADGEIKKYLKAKGFNKDIFILPLYTDTSIFNEYADKIDITDKRDFSFLYIIENADFSSIEKTLKLYFEQIDEKDNISLIIGCLSGIYDKISNLLQIFCAEYDNVPDIILLDITYDMLPSLFKSVNVFLWDKDYIGFMPLSAAATKLPVLNYYGIQDLMAFKTYTEFNIKNIADNFAQALKIACINYDYIQLNSNRNIVRNNFSHNFFRHILNENIKKQK